MKLSVMIFPFHAQLADGRLDAHVLIKALHDNGAVAIETMHCFHQEAPEVFAELLRAAQENGLSVSCHDIGIDLIGSDGDREERLQQARAQIDFAHEKLNAPTVLLYDSRQSNGNSIEECRRIYARSLALLADYAEKQGIVVTIENYDLTPELACSARHCLEILELAGAKPRLTFDTGNFLAVGERAPAVFPMLRDRIGHVHAKDVVPIPGRPGHFRMCVAGRGIAQPGKCMELLMESGYRGCISVEIAGGTLDDAVASLRYLREINCASQSIPPSGETPAWET